MERKDPFRERAYELAREAGLDPDGKIDRPGQRPMPVWCTFREVAQKEKAARDAKALEKLIAVQDPSYQDSPLTIIGDHEESTVQQMRNCMRVGNAVAGAICADGHLGYAQPVGGVIAYENQISISGVGFDIACGNMAVRLDTKFQDIERNVFDITRDISKIISFGMGRTNKKKIHHDLFDDDESWKASDMEEYRQKARDQLGTVGSGNHYVDLLRDENDDVWIGVHFGSRGLGHTSSTHYLKAAGGQDGIHVPPTVVDEDSEIGLRYIAAMELAGRYAYAGREWVVERVRQIIGGTVQDTIHNHHNFAWKETHGGKNLWVVRKGCTPAFPGQRGFVGGSMGDNAVILEGVDSQQAKDSLYSTVHGAGRVFGRAEAKRRFTRSQMDQWLLEQGVTLRGGDLDESPMAYRRLPEVLAYHTPSVKVLHTLKPFSVCMAGSKDFDPFKD